MFNWHSDTEESSESLQSDPAVHNNSSVFRCVACGCVHDPPVSKVTWTEWNGGRGWSMIGILKYISELSFHMK